MEIMVVFIFYTVDKTRRKLNMSVFDQLEQE